LDSVPSWHVRTFSIARVSVPAQSEKYNTVELSRSAGLSHSTTRRAISKHGNIPIEIIDHVMIAEIESILFTSPLKEVQEKSLTVGFVSAIERGLF